MSKHYLELQFELHPQTVMDREYKVFSVKKLYGDNKAINHRLHPFANLTEERIFQQDEWDDTLLYPLIALAMKEKLCTYARTQLPGGRYWEPEQPIEAILKELRPSNDLCESILGLNDYLTTAIPNLHQQAKSNLIQVKKNKTMQCLHELSDDQRKTIIELAVKRRVEVERLYKEAEAQRSKQRREKLIDQNRHREASQAALKREKERLSSLHLITSMDELKKKLSEIDNEANSKKKKLSLIREQINIRRKLLNQKVKFTSHRKGKSDL